MPQTLVYSNNITLDDFKNLKLTVLGYYEITVVANSHNENATFELTISQVANGVTGSVTSRSSSQWFGQNSLTTILKVDTPCSIVVNLRSSSNDNSRTCWTTVKWISM
jgi:hypothetical protein